MNFWLFELLGLQMATWICSVASALIIGTLLLRNGIESNLLGGAAIAAIEFTHFSELQIQGQKNLFCTRSSDWPGYPSD